MHDRDFKGIWIPCEIWIDGRLDAVEKVILAEIVSLDKGKDGCYASNKHIADFCQCSASKVSRSIAKLIELGYIYAEKFDGRQRILKTTLKITPKYTLQSSETCEADLSNSTGSLSKYPTPPKQISYSASANCLQSNTYSNTGSIKKENIKRKRGEVFKPPTLEEVQAYCLERNNSVDAERFVNYYTSNGWLVGKTKMKDWKAAVRTWERSSYNNAPKQNQQAARAQTSGNIFLDMLKERGEIIDG